MSALAVGKQFFGLGLGGQKGDALAMGRVFGAALTERSDEVKAELGIRPSGRQATAGNLTLYDAVRGMVSKAMTNTMGAGEDTADMLRRSSSVFPRDQFLVAPLGTRALTDNKGLGAWPALADRTDAAYVSNDLAIQPDRRNHEPVIWHLIIHGEAYGYTNGSFTFDQMSRELPRGMPAFARRKEGVFHGVARDKNYVIEVRTVADMVAKVTRELRDAFASTSNHPKNDDEIRTRANQLVAGWWFAGILSDLMHIGDFGITPAIDVQLGVGGPTSALNLWVKKERPMENGCHLWLQFYLDEDTAIANQLFGQEHWRTPVNEGYHGIRVMPILTYNNTEPRFSPDVLREYDLDEDDLLHAVYVGHVAHGGAYLTDSNRASLESLVDDAMVPSSAPEVWRTERRAEALQRGPTIILLPSVCI